MPSAGADAAAARAARRAASRGARQGEGGGGGGGAAFVVVFGDGAAQWHSMPRWLSEAAPGDEDALRDLLV
jgi:hypothetical protein